MNRLRNTIVKIFSWLKNLDTETKMQFAASGLILGGTILSLTAGNDDNNTIDITDDAIVSDADDSVTDFVPSTIE